MEAINDGGLAFPFACQGPTTAPEIYYGMSLRAYFAGQAMQGLLANSEGGSFLNADGTPCKSLGEIQEVIAVGAVGQADALLAALKGGA